LAGSAADDSDLDSAPQKQPDRETISDRKTFSVFTIGRVDQAAVGEYAIDIEHDKADRLELFTDIGG
jgi:hypothetical protein